MKKNLLIVIFILLLMFWTDIENYISLKYPNFKNNLQIYIKQLFSDIPIIIFLTLLTFLVYKYVIILILARMKEYETIGKIKKHFGSLQNIGVSGAVNTFKTSTFVFCVNILESLKIDSRRLKMRYIKHKCQFIDFNDINSYIDENLDIYKSMCDDDYKELAASTLLKYEYINENEDPIYIKTAFKEISIIDMIGQYIELYYIEKFRRSNVVSNVSIYSENTGEYPYIIKEDYFTMFKNMDMKLEKYMIVLDDEKGVFDNYKKSMKRDSHSIDENDDGKSEFFMLFRHPFQGTTLRIGIQQNLSDFVANQRRQYQMIVNMNSEEDWILFDLEKQLINRLISYLDHKEINYYNKKIKELEAIKKPNKKYFKLKYKLTGYFDRPNRYNFLKSKLFDILDFLENKEILMLRMSLYYSVDDVGKDLYRENPSTKSLAFPMTLFIPKNRTFPYYDTHSYSALFKHLKKNTDGSILTTEQFKSTSITDEEFDSMNYQAYKKMLERIQDKQHSQESSSIEKW